MDHEIARTLRTVLQHQSGLHCVRFLPPCCPVWLMVMIDEFHGLDATARLVLYALRPRTSSSSSLSPRISLRFLALLIYFHFAGQQQQPQPQQLLLLLLNLIQLNFVIHFVRLLLEPLPSTLSLPFAFFRYTEYQQAARRATRNAFLAFRTFPTFA